MLVFRNQERYWRESVFEGVGIVRAALDESYGVGKVSIGSAALRWLNHHSLMSSDHGGGVSSEVTHLTIFLSLSLFHPLDVIILGASKLEHLVNNLEACQEEPLDQRMYIATTIPDFTICVCVCVQV